MSDKKTLTFLLMDPPYENARSTTALRLIDVALRRGFDVNVFAYEGAVALPFAKQAPHANAVHGRDVAAEDLAMVGRERDDALVAEPAPVDRGDHGAEERVELGDARAIEDGDRPL